MSEVVIYEKVRSCPYCGAFKKKDGWNYAKQMCGCGFGKIPTPEEIEADDYSTAQVQNMHREITTLTTELTECRAENERLGELELELAEAKAVLVTRERMYTAKLTTLRQAAQKAVDETVGVIGCDALEELGDLLEGKE